MNSAVTKIVATRLAMSTTGYAYVHSSTFMLGRSLLFSQKPIKLGQDN
ncbi:hypothetical protein [Nostoc sp.]